MSAPTSTNSGGNPPVTPLGRQFYDPIAALADEFSTSGMTPTQFETAHGLKAGHGYWLRDRIVAGQLRWSDKLAGSGWTSVTLAYPVVDATAPRPAYIVSPYPPRQCDVTDTWFVPTDPRQRFRPGLSEAVKRAARRDLTRARVRFQLGGDWGVK